MKIHNFFTDYFKTRDCVVSIGVFDGLHRGHQRIIDTCIKSAKQLDCESVIITFNVNPKMAKGTEEKMKSLLAKVDFNQLLVNCGVDNLCIIDFSEIGFLSGLEFIKLLCSLYKVRTVVVGSSFRCGNKDFSIGVKEMERLLPLKVVESVFENGIEISSTQIRKDILSGKMSEITKLLGRNYFLNLDNLKPYNIESKIDLKYSYRGFEQLLPCSGTYKVKVSGIAADSPTPCPSDCDAVAVITEQDLILYPERRIEVKKIIFF